MWVVDRKQEIYLEWPYVSAVKVAVHVKQDGALTESCVVRPFVAGHLSIGAGAYNL